MNAETFNIIINDEQRQLLITALAQCKLQGYFGADAEQREEIDLLHDMLDALPEDDADEENMQHDFTL